MGCDEDVFQGRDNGYKVVATCEGAPVTGTFFLESEQDLRDRVAALIKELSKPIYVVLSFDAYEDADILLTMDTTLVFRSLEDAETVCKFKNLQEHTNCWKVYGPYKVGEIK